MAMSNTVYHLADGDIAHRADKVRECEYCHRYVMRHNWQRHLGVCWLLRLVTVTASPNSNRFAISLGDTKIATAIVRDDGLWLLEDDKTMTPVVGFSEEEKRHIQEYDA